MQVTSILTRVPGRRPGLRGRRGTWEAAARAAANPGVLWAETRSSRGGKPVSPRLQKAPSSADAVRAASGAHVPSLTSRTEGTLVLFQD